MSTFISRTTAPAYSDKNYIHYLSGGYNYAINISNGSVLPNCVGYAWGRWRELLGRKHNLSTSNAENWYGNTSDGYERGTTPKVGAVICWRKGQAGNSSDGAGHVGIVEDVNVDGSIVVSNSAYGGDRFYTMTLSAPYNIGSKYSFQGFIYLPTEYDEVESSTGAENTTGAESSVGLVWWGDIVKIVLIILLVIIACGMLVLGVKGTVFDNITGG